jgi:hypothetical protein
MWRTINRALAIGATAATTAGLPASTKVTTLVAAAIAVPVRAAGTRVPSGYAVRSARDFGVACDGSKDDTVALQAALNAVGPYQALQLPAGTCPTSHYVTFYGKSNVIVFGAGKDATIILAQDPRSSAFVVEQSNRVALEDFQVYSPNATTRISDGAARGFSINNSRFVTVQRVKGRKVANAVTVWRTNDSKILDSEALDTFADSFHVTGAARRILVQGNVARNAGDDSFSSIGYANEGANADVQLIGNRSYDGRHGSCFSFEGTINGKALRNRCYRSGAAGIRVQSWNTYPTAPVDGVEIADNYIEGAVTRRDLASAHGAITIVTNYNHLRDIVVSRNTIKDPRAYTAILVKGASGSVNVTGSATGNIFLNTTGALRIPIAVNGFATFARTGNIFNGQRVP